MWCAKLYTVTSFRAVGCRNNIMMQSVSDSDSLSGGRGAKRKKVRQFDFSLWNSRHVAFKIAYIGWNYRGFAFQECTTETVEAKLFESLIETKLIQDRSTCNFSRCGRTDKEVSALSQVVALNVRSNLLDGLGVIINEDGKAHDRKGDKSMEINYMHILNKTLPRDIRIIGYSPVHVDFSARFNCLQRKYKHYFPLGNMNIEAIKLASKKFLGNHDFRNFCKMDIRGGVTNSKRTISDITIQPVDSSSKSSPYEIYEITVTSKAFLQHQIRCMIGVLFLIGNEQEKPELIDFMLDVNKCPGKPQYKMASGYPLILYDCSFEDIDWQIDTRSYWEVFSQFQQMWTRLMIKTTMVNKMLETLQVPLLSKHQLNSVTSNNNRPGNNHKPIKTRPTADTIEKRIEYHQSKKKKLDEQNTTDKS